MLKTLKVLQALVVITVTLTPSIGIAEKFLFMGMAAIVLTQLKLQGKQSSKKNYIVGFTVVAQVLLVLSFLIGFVTKEAQLGYTTTLLLLGIFSVLYKEKTN